MIWLDMDGVLADFDTHYLKCFGYIPTRWPLPDTTDWELVSSVPDFYLKIPLMKGAYDLFRYVDELGLGTGILTGIPKSIDAADNDKRQWAQLAFPDTPVVCCPARDKWRHAKPGDVLIDDYLKYRVDWERAGGVFVHHTSVANTIAQLGGLISWNVIGEQPLH